MIILCLRYALDMSVLYLYMIIILSVVNFVFSMTFLLKYDFFEKLVVKETFFLITILLISSQL